MVTGALGLALSSSPAGSGSMPLRHPQRAKPFAAVAQAGGTGTVGSPASTSLSKSAPVAIPVERRTSVASSIGSATPREHGLEDRAARKLSGLVAPLRPPSYSSPKTVGFAPNQMPNMTSAPRKSFFDEVADQDKRYKNKGTESKSPEGKSSLLTRALHGEKMEEVEEEDVSLGIVGAFSHMSEEKSLSQEKELANTLVERHEIFGAPLVKLAFEIARCAHTGQFRRDKKIYLAHVVETADILANLGLDEETVAAGLLHDVLDDTMMTQRQLREFIPAGVSDMVVGVSRMSQVSRLNRDQLGAGDDDPATQSDRFKNMLLSMGDVRTVLIKLADRLHNMRTLGSLAPHKQREVAQESLHVFVPLANRLGVWSIKAELEDLCFKYLNGPEFHKLESLMNDDFMARQREQLQTNLDVLQEAIKARGDIDCKDLHGRPKNVFGIHKKMKKKNLAFEEVHDLCACRVIVETKEECYEVLDLVHSLWKPMEGKFKDYIKDPKANGYQSLHSVVLDEGGLPFEVQIRTAEMHFISEFGVAAHWQYKETAGASSEGRKNKRIEQQIAWNRWLLTWQMELQDRKYRPSGSPGQEPKEVLLSFPSDEPCPPAESEYDPIYAIVSTGDAVVVQEVPANCTIAELRARQSGMHEYLVNHDYVNSEYVVKMGDLLELIHTDYDEEAAADLYAFERHKLNKIFQAEQDAMGPDPTVYTNTV